MNKRRYSTVCFWMDVFESFYSMDNVKGFKELLLKNKGNLDDETITLILDIYGLRNTDVFKPSLQEDKLYKLNVLLDMFNCFYEVDDLEKYNKAVASVKNMRLGGTVEELLYKILGVKDTPIVKKNGYVSKSTNSSVARELNENTRSSREEEYKASLMMNESRSLYSASTDYLKYCRQMGINTDAVKVLIDVLERVNMDKLSEVVIRYDNPRYDGCSGNPMYKYYTVKELLSETIKHSFKGVEYVLKVKISDGDGCSRGPSYRYESLPNTYKRE